MRNHLTILIALAIAAFLATNVPAEDKVETMDGLPLVFADDFEDGMDKWETTDPDKAKGVWELIKTDRGQSLRVTGASKYKPPVRSPHSIAWTKDLSVSDFILTAKVHSTNYNAGNHRDLCLFWGRQDAAHFYYVHFGAKADPHACQIFIVDGEPRKKITVKEAEGTPWTKQWHEVKVVRKVEDGTIEVYFDDMEKPMMTAKDDRFKSGPIGLGTFDDNGNFDDVKIYGKKIEDEGSKSDDQSKPVTER